MTWVTTHFALEGMIAYLFIGYALRNKFLHSNGTRALFILTNFFAVIPDFDVEIGLLIGDRMHRGLSHSIFFPLSFVIIGISLYIIKYKLLNLIILLLIQINSLNKKVPQKIKSSTYYPMYSL